MMLRIAVSRPPGVSICSTTSCACSCAARSSARATRSALAGPMAPSMRTTKTDGTASPVGGLCARASPTSSANKTIQPTRLSTIHSEESSSLDASVHPRGRSVLAASTHPNRTTPQRKRWQSCVTNSLPSGGRPSHSSCSSVRWMSSRPLAQCSRIDCRLNS